MPVVAGAGGAGPEPGRAPSREVDRLYNAHSSKAAVNHGRATIGRSHW